MLRLSTYFHVLSYRCFYTWCLCLKRTAKFPLYTPLRHVGEWKYSFCPPHWMDWVVSSTSRPLSPHGKTCQYPMNSRLAGPQNRKMSCPCHEWNDDYQSRSREGCPGYLYWEQTQWIYTSFSSFCSVYILFCTFPIFVPNVDCDYVRVAKCPVILLQHAATDFFFLIVTALVLMAFCNAGCGFANTYQWGSNMSAFSPSRRLLRR